MRNFGRIVMGLGLAAGLAGCASIHDHRGFLVDPMLTDSIVPGIDNKVSVERALGRPTFVAEYGEPVWYYIAMDTKQKAFTRPRVNSELIYRVRFDKNDNVTSFTKENATNIAHFNPVKDKTPTLGRTRTFWQDLFGNIGTVGAPGMGMPGQGGSNRPAGSGPNGSN